VYKIAFEVGGTSARDLEENKYAFSAAEVVPLA